MDNQNRLEKLANKNERKNYRLTTFDCKLLKLAARYKAGANESLWFFQHIWADACEMLASEHFGARYTPFALQTLFLHAFHRLSQAPPDAERAERWILDAIEILDKIADDPWTSKSRESFEKLMAGYPTDWLNHLSKQYAEVAAFKNDKKP